MAEGLDATWCRPGDPAVQLHWPGAGVVATMRVSSPSVHIVAASPSEVDAVAVEPQTHAPHGLRRLLDGRPGGLALLEPGATLELGVELILERVPAG
jgi:galactose mutarotase-like enzyme